MLTVSIAEVMGRGVTIQPHEAVAVAQEVASAAAAEPSTTGSSHAPPALQTVRLGPDGSVTSAASDGVPSISEIATFLQAMLASPGKVTGALRFMIARALLEVDVPPFDSLEEFLRVLARFESSDRRAALRLLVERYLSAGGVQTSVGAHDSKPKPGVAPIVTVLAGPPALGLIRRPAPATHDRRRVGSHVSALRRDLRDADRQLFAQQVVRHKTAKIVRMPTLSVAP